MPHKARSPRTPVRLAPSAAVLDPVTVHENLLAELGMAVQRRRMRVSKGEGRPRGVCRGIGNPVMMQNRHPSRVRMVSHADAAAPVTMMRRAVWRHPIMMPMMTVMVMVAVMMVNRRGGSWRRDRGSGESADQNRA